MPDMIFVDSSNIEQVGYDPAAEELHIVFVKTGLYIFFGVPQFVYDELLAADSKGSYFNRNIKPVYTNYDRRG